MLKLQGIKAGYGNIEALHGIDLEVKEGEIVTLIGSNGAGKSTTLRTISGLIRPRKGAVVYEGNSLLSVPGHKIVASGICHSPEGRRIFPRMTVQENLDLGAFLRNDKAEIDADLARVLELFPRLQERISQKAGTLSGGEQQMLAVGRALMSEPRLLLLDEPSLGLAPLVIAEIFSALDELRAQGVTILLVEQDARLALRHADRGSVMRTGRVVLEGPAEDLLADESVRTIYLGAWHQEGS